MTGEKTTIDVKALSKKYRTNVAKLIQAWKQEYSDMEIARSFGINLSTLHQIKSDIELTHRRLRLEKNNKSTDGFHSSKHHIFLSPFM